MNSLNSTHLNISPYSEGWGATQAPHPIGESHRKGVLMLETYDDNGLMQMLINAGKKTGKQADTDGDRFEQDETRRNILKILTERHSARLYRIIKRMGVNSETAEDILQDAFIKLWLTPEKFNGKYQFISWFTRVVMNLTIDYQRKIGRRAEIITDDFTMFASEKSNATYEEVRYKIFIKAFQSLPQKQQSAVNLCFFENHSNQEAADIMGLKLKALQSLVMRGKQNMKDYVSKETGDA